MRRRGFTLVEILIVVTIIGILLSIAVPQWSIARENSREKVQESNCQAIDHAKQRWIMGENLDGDATPNEADLVPRYLDKLPACPGNCTYDLGSGTVPCSWH